MKTFKSFLTESADLESIVDFMRREAPKQVDDILNQRGPFYRGLDTINDDPILTVPFEVNGEPAVAALYEMSINQNRKSIGLGAKNDTRINDYFENKFGIRYRQTSVFVSANPRQAKGYATGALGLVFPASDDAKWMYSPNVEDLFNYFDEGPFNAKYKLGEIPLGSDPYDDQFAELEWDDELVARYMDSFEWVVTENPGKILKAGMTNEVLLNDPSAKSYYFVTVQYGENGDKGFSHDQDVLKGLFY